MSLLKAPIEVRSLKSGKVTVHASSAIDVTTADFVSATPRILHVADGAIKAVFIRHEADLRDINRARQGQKELTPELTGTTLVGATR